MPGLTFAAMFHDLGSEVGEYSVINTNKNDTQHVINQNDTLILTSDWLVAVEGIWQQLEALLVNPGFCVQRN